MKPQKIPEETAIIQLIPEHHVKLLDLISEIVTKNIIESNKVHKDINKGSVEFLNRRAG